MKCLIAGASAGLGRALAEGLAAAGHDLFLVASDSRDLAAVAGDIALRTGVGVDVFEADFAASDGASVWREATRRLGESPTAVFVVAGAGDDRDCGPVEQAVLDRLVAVNFQFPVGLVNAALPDMLAGRTKLCLGIGSVAAARGRSVNMVYGAAKRGLEGYFEAVRHRVGDSGCRVQFYRVGFMRTKMLGGRSTMLPAVSPESVARRILENLDRDFGMAYAPAWWAAVAGILRVVPWWLFRRLSI